MNEPLPERPAIGFWTLNKVFVLLLLGAIAALLLEIRYDHRDVIHETPISWTPLIYAGLTLLLGIIGLATWDRFGRVMLLFVFAIGMIVGPVGFWFHNQGKPVRGIARMMSAWDEPIYAGEPEKKGRRERGETGGAGENAEKAGAQSSAGREQADESKRDSDEAGPPARGSKPEKEDRGDSDQPNNGGVALQHPPILAPLSFFGLGLMGVVACMDRFQPGRYGR